MSFFNGQSEFQSPIYLRPPAGAAVVGGAVVAAAVVAAAVTEAEVTCPAATDDPKKRMKKHPQINEQFENFEINFI